MRIEIVVFPGFDELDAVGPLEVLRNAVGAGADATVALVGLPGAGETITGSHGMQVGTDGAAGESADLLIVPGGGWNDRSPRGARAEVERGVLPAAVGRAADRGAVVAGVCTGVMVLAAAGLVAGRPAVTHHRALEELAAAGARVLPGARVVDDGNLVTCGGVTSGIDLALWLVERLWGAALADGTAREMEYLRSDAVVAPGRP